MDFCEIISQLDNEKTYAKENYVPIIREESAKYLYDFVNNHDFKNILEIGTAIGFSGSIMLAGSSANLTTIDINADYLELAKQTFARLNFSDRVEILEGDAWDIIHDLRENGRKFDMIFLDGAKGQYVKYLDILTQLLNNNGVILLVD